MRDKGNPDDDHGCGGDAGEDNRSPSDPIGHGPCDHTRNHAANLHKHHRGTLTFRAEFHDVDKVKWHEQDDTDLGHAAHGDDQGKVPDGRRPQNGTHTATVVPQIHSSAVAASLQLFLPRHKGKRYNRQCHKYRKRHCHRGFLPCED